LCGDLTLSFGSSFPQISRDVRNATLDLPARESARNLILAPVLFGKCASWIKAQMSDACGVTKLVVYSELYFSMIEMISSSVLVVKSGMPGYGRTSANIFL
jgi:hypothetical protein